MELLRDERLPEAIRQAGFALTGPAPADIQRAGEVPSCRLNRFAAAGREAPWKRLP